MNIGIVGAGHIGSTVADHFAKAGHSVTISNSKGPESLSSLVASADPHIKAATAEDAIRFGEVILIAIPWASHDALPDAKLFENKIVIDALNSYGVDFGESTSSEVLSQQLPGARLVKGFNTMASNTLRTGGRPAGPDQLVLFISGDDTEAKATVAHLMEEIGFAAVDAGFLHDGGLLQQAGGPLYNVPMTLAEARTRLANL